MTNISTFIQADDSINFIRCIRDNNMHLNLYQSNGTKKDCVFCQCAYFGSCSCIRAAVANGIMCIHNDKNASYFAASSNQINALIFLNNLRQDFENAILGAIKYGQYQSFIWILENHYETAHRNMENCKSLFQLAARGGNIKVFNYLKHEFHNQYMIEEENCFKSQNPNPTIIEIACAHNNFDLVELLLSQNKTNKLTDLNLLAIPIHNNNLCLFEMLLKFYDKYIDTNYLLNCAIQSKNTDAISFLVNQYQLKPTGLLFAAITINSFEFVKSLLQTFSLNINEKNEYGILFLVFLSNTTPSSSENRKY